MVLFYGLTKVYTVENGFLPKSSKYNKLFQILNLEKGLIIGFVMIIVGIALSIYSYTNWKSLDYRAISGNNILRTVILAITTILVGVQTILFSLFFSILGLKK